MLAVNASFWQDRRVLVTGHTGFKGSWLTLWLKRLGAVVTGYSLAPDSEPSLFNLLGLHDERSIFGDVRDAEKLAAVALSSAPEIVFHLAAQALVRPSYQFPVETFATNVVGTAALLNAVRGVPSVRAVVSVTSDKCYENREWVWGYRETDHLGGHDPYSASKAAAEIVTASMRQSFFSPYSPTGHPARIASVRAGNVIGGGDWSPERLIPDIVRSCLAEEGVVRLRSPGAVRPWQHVLEPVSAYLALAERLCTSEPGIDEAFNFGPSDGRTVLEVARAIVSALGSGSIEVVRSENLHEAGLLRLDCSKASSRLGWTPRLDFTRTIQMTAEWYTRYAQGEEPREITLRQIDEFESMSPRRRNGNTSAVTP